MADVGNLHCRAPPSKFRNFQPILERPGPGPKDIVPSAPTPGPFVKLVSNAPTTDIDKFDAR